MICATKQQTTMRHGMSCRQLLARKLGVLLCTANLQQQMHRWKVDLHTATAARAGAQPMDTRPQQAAITQPPQG
jgi:succinylglutamate desuccinylase